MSDLRTTLKTDLLLAMSGAVQRALNDRAGLRPLHWLVDLVRTEAGQLAVTGMATSGDYVEHEVAEVLEAWAGLLGLDRQEPVTYQPGALIYRGVVDGVHVEVWGVIDREAWEAPSTDARPTSEQENEK